MKLELTPEIFTQEIALYKGKSGSYEYITTHGHALEHSTDYLRLSDYVTIEFKPRSDSAILVEEIDKLVVSKDKIMQEALKEIAEIEDRIQELKAITYQES